MVFSIVKLTDIECGPLNVRSWKNLKDHKKIIKAVCSKMQLNELQNMDNILINYIKSLGREQRIGLWIKTKNGYTIIRYCNLMKGCRCNSKWLFKVNVPSGQAEIHFLKLCDHI